MTKIIYPASYKELNDANKWPELIKKEPEFEEFVREKYFLYGENAPITFNDVRAVFCMPCDPMFDKVGALVRDLLPEAKLTWIIENVDPSGLT